MFGYRLGGRKILLVWIYLLTSYPKPVTYVRPRSKAGTSYIPYNITLTHALANLYISLGYVKILGSVGIVMLYLYIIAISCSIARGDHSPVSGTPDRSAMRRCIICSLVSFPGFLHRMKAVTGETGRYTTEIKRSFKEETLQRSSIFIIES